LGVTTARAGASVGTVARFDDGPAARLPRADVNNGPMPNLFIVGAMKSGTTTLARVLAGHPEVRMAPRKEVHYYDREYARGRSWYLGQFGKDLGQRYSCDATPVYMFDPVARARLLSDVTDVSNVTDVTDGGGDGGDGADGAEFVAVLRNPIDRAYSHYWHERRMGHERLSFADALAAEPERLASGDRYAMAHFSYVARGRYAEQLDVFAEAAGRKHVHVYMFEELSEDPVGLFDTLTRDLGIAPLSLLPGAGGVRNAFREPRLHQLSSISRRLPRQAGRVLRRVNSRPAAYAPLDPAMRSELSAVFRESNASLRSWLSSDLSRWEHAAA
jgi:hypothetical protein